MSRNLRDRLFYIAGAVAVLVLMALTWGAPFNPFTIELRLMRLEERIQKLETRESIPKERR